MKVSTQILAGLLLSSSALAAPHTMTRDAPEQVIPATPIKPSASSLQNAPVDTLHRRFQFKNNLDYIPADKQAKYDEMEGRFANMEKQFGNKEEKSAEMGKPIPVAINSNPTTTGSKPLNMGKPIGNATTVSPVTTGSNTPNIGEWVAELEKKLTDMEKKIADMEGKFVGENGKLMARFTFKNNLDYIPADKQAKYDEMEKKFGNMEERFTEKEKTTGVNVNSTLRTMESKRADMEKRFAELAKRLAEMEKRLIINGKTA
ncbi:hypothetical protein H072_7723 [Dactylellina haptotyla CBS 200.50]|uniref:Uncharacterized protein n=1 Tax=Dactylellina haptotyla (strain CBS 200.50) TaxID=1284197 RepID=S8BTD7_DACHA|nr:hypothetical protein H072_7723 [Dactylellina haptotyla CBS 200.50]